MAHAPVGRLFRRQPVHGPLKIDLRGDPIVIEKEDSPFHLFVRDFLACWPNDIPYVLVSGYVALLFGRERHTEDIDLLAGRMEGPVFFAWWRRLGEAGFWCLNTGDPTSAWEDYLRTGLALRFALKPGVEPNMEVKFARDAPGHYALGNRQPLRLNGRPLWVAPLDQQVAFKLYLGSDKDLEDARHLLGTLKERLNRGTIESWADTLGVPPEARKRGGLER